MILDTMKTQVRRFTYLMMIILLGLVQIGMAENQKASDGETLLAIGDGVKVTASDMEEMRTHFESNRIFLKPEKYQVAALEMKLYAKEASELNLDSSVTYDKSQDDFEREKNLATIYLDHLIQTYPLEELIIESYYRAHPQKFEQWNESAQAYEAKPIDDEVRQKIREIILAPKKRKIQQDEYQRLVEKYNVRLCDLTKGCIESL